MGPLSYLSHPVSKCAHGSSGVIASKNEAFLFFFVFFWRLLLIA